MTKKIFNKINKEIFIKDYFNKETYIMDLCKKHNISVGCLYRYVDFLKLEKRGRGYHNTLKLNINKIITLYKKGLTMSELSNIFKCSIPTIKKRLNDNNINIKYCGEKVWNWKGGITTINNKIRASICYKKWRESIFKKNNYTCFICKNRGNYLEAHHIKEFHKILKEYNIKSLNDSKKCKELWNINNGITVCKDCHKKIKKSEVTNMEIKLVEKDILKILKRNFGDDIEILEITDDGIKIDADIDFFNAFKKLDTKVGSDSSFRKEKRAIQSKENQELSPEQERYIRMEMAKHGATGKDYSKSPPMKTDRSIDRYSGEKVPNKSNTIIDRKSKSIIDGVN